MSDGALTQKEIDELLSGTDEKYVQGRILRKQALERSALTPWGVMRAIRDARMGEYRINFTLSDEEAEKLIIRYAKMYKKGRG
jgi:hypothetical protein